MINLAPWMQAHAPGLYAAIPTICALLAGWAALATILIKQVKRPTAPEWKAVLYHVFLDWPSLLPGLGLKGIFGLPVSIPFLHLSRDDGASAKVSVFVPFFFMAGSLLGFGVAYGGCAHMTPAQRSVYDKIYLACFEQKGIAHAPEIGQEVLTDLGGTDAKTIEQQLGAVTAQAGTDAVACALQAWEQMPAKKSAAALEATRSWRAKQKQARDDKKRDGKR